MPLTFLSIIASRPVGTMFQRTGSAWIQYSRRAPARFAARIGDAAASRPAAALTFGGTGTSVASRSTSACSPAKTFWPASVHNSSPPVPANSSRRPNGSMLIERPTASR